MAKKFSVEISIREKGKNKRAVDLSAGELSGEITFKELLGFVKDTLIVTAYQALKYEQAHGFDPDPIVIVDKKKNKDIKDVHPLGEIRFISRQDMGMMLIDTYLGLLHRSKVLYGNYIQSHYVFHNGTQVATDLSSLQRWLGFRLLGEGPEFKQGDIVRFVNIQPYGRKLELLGVTAQRTEIRREDKGRRKKIKTGQYIKRPNGTYQLTEKSVKRKYGKNAAIRFQFIPGSQMGLTDYFKMGKKGSVGRTYLYPSITFTVQSKGIL